jgi:hypothetical protein
VKFKAKAAPRDLERLAELARFSPVFNIITQGARVDIQVEPK